MLKRGKMRVCVFKLIQFENGRRGIKTTFYQLRSNRNLVVYF